MSFKTVTDLSTDTTISLGGTNRKTGKKNPTSIEGYYLGSRQIEDKKKKSGISYIYTFQTPQGNVGVWGKTDLDRKMQGVAPGVMTRASFDKMVPTPNGEMYKYKVEVDTDNTVEVSAQPSRVEQDNGYSRDEETLSSFSSFGSEEEQDEDPSLDEALAEAAARRAASQAKVNALLKKAK